MMSYLRPWTTLAVGVAIGYFGVPWVMGKIGH